MRFDPDFFADQFARLHATAHDLAQEIVAVVPDNILDLGMSLGTRDFDAVQAALRLGVRPPLHGITPTFACTFDTLTAHQKLAIAHRSPAWKSTFAAQAQPLFDHIAATVPFLTGTLGSFILRRRMMWTSQPGWFVTINGLPLAYNNERKMTGCAEAIPAITSVLTQAQAWETPNKVYALRGSYKVAASSPIEAMRLYACSYEALDEWPRTVLIDTPI